MATRFLGKINGRLRFLYRKQHFLDFSLRRLLANALIQPHFDYASSAWFPLLNKRLTKRIQTAQNKCIRFCLNLNNRAHIGIKEFKNINWLPTKERFEQCTTAKVFKFFDNSAPSYMSEMFLPVGQSRITHRSKNKLNQPFRKSNIGQSCLSYLGPKVWNNLPSELKSAKNIDSFKHKIKDTVNSSMISKVKMIAPTYTIENAKFAYENGIIIFFKGSFFSGTNFFLFL